MGGVAKRSKASGSVTILKSAGSNPVTAQISAEGVAIRSVLRILPCHVATSDGSFTIEFNGLYEVRSCLRV